MATFTDGQVVQFRSEIVAQFETRQSYLRDTVLTESMINGGTASFLVSGSNGATAVTRGPTGEIPAVPNYRAQNFVVLKEKHSVIEETGFVDFVSQGSARQLMQMNVMTPIYKTIDEEIINELTLATQDLGAAAALTPALAIAAKVKLRQNAVATSFADTFAVITPAAMGQLERYPQFTSSDYVELKQLPGSPRVRQWLGIKWIEDENLPGVGSTSATCFFYDRHAIGHAVNKAGMSTVLDYDKRHDLTFARCSLFHGAKLLQPNGVVKFFHNDQAAFA